MSFDAEKLYELLPAFARIRDNERGQQVLTQQDNERVAQLKAQLSSIVDQDSQEAEQLRKLIDEKERGPLKALLSVIAEQMAVLEEDLEQLYDDQFIETCAEWVVPYIGDLIGTRGLFVFSGAPFSQRAQVANTLAYRRRKGTAAVLEQLARDVTAWDASVIEYFQLLATTQYMNHLRPDNLAIASLRRRHFAGLLERQSVEDLSMANQRQWETMERLNTPFDTMTHTVDVRRIESRRGKYNIPNVGIYLWRIGSYSITDAPAYKVPDIGDASIDGRRYLFNAIGQDTPLYNLPETEDEITHLAEPTNVPMPISRRILNRDLDIYYGIDKSLLIYRDGQDITFATASPPASRLSDLIQVCDLSDVKDVGGNVIGWAHVPQDKIAIDPVLGRIAFPASQSPQNVHVTYHYGFSAEMGGGEYGHEATFSGLKKVVKVPSDEPTIQTALAKLTTELDHDPQLEGGVIEIERPKEIVKNDYHILTGSMSMPAGKSIELRAADEHRPVIVIDGELIITGDDDAEVDFNGLIITGGRLRVPSVNNHLRALRLRHCTLTPGPSPAIKGVAAQPAGVRIIVEEPFLIVEIDRCIVGPIRAGDGARFRIRNSIVDAGKETNIAYAAPGDDEVLSPPAADDVLLQPGAPLKVENTTVIGKVHTTMMELASNTIFLASLKAFDSWPAPVLSERLQQGCARFSYVPPGSRTPRRYNCQPDLVDKPIAAQFAQDKITREEKDQKQESERLRVHPVFTSLRYGDAGYCQLSPHCAVEITRGADDQAEMGAFHDLYQPQREGNLRARLDEYLRFGLEAGIFYAS